MVSSLRRGALPLQGGSGVLAQTFQRLDQRVQIRLCHTVTQLAFKSGNAALQAFVTRQTFDCRGKAFQPGIL